MESLVICRIVISSQSNSLPKELLMTKGKRMTLQWRKLSDVIKLHRHSNETNQNCATQQDSMRRTHHHFCDILTKVPNQNQILR